MRDLMRLVNKRLASGKNTIYHGTVLRQINSDQKCHKQIIYQNVRNLLLFLQMCSMKQFPGTIQKYLTKREHDRLVWLFCESSDREKSNRDICLIYLSGGERDLHIVENFITDERARFYSRYICSLISSSYPKASFKVCAFSMTNQSIIIKRRT